MNTTLKTHQGKGSTVYEDALSIRKAVFVVEQKIDARLEVDENEEKATYVVVYSDGIPASTGRFRKTEKGVKLERFATLPAFRGKGTGTIVLGKILELTLPLKDEIYLHSQESAVGFYLKNGFSITGDPFYEAGIKHYRMVYKP